MKKIKLRTVLIFVLLFSALGILFYICGIKFGLFSKPWIFDESYQYTTGDERDINSSGLGTVSLTPSLFTMAVSTPAPSDTSVMVAEAVATSTHEIYYEPNMCWEELIGFLKNYGPPRSMATGPNNTLWVLRNNALWWGTINGEGKTLVFGEELGCENCDDIFDGSLEVSMGGEAWLGMTSGVLIVSPDTLSWRMIPREQIFQDTNNDNYSVRVLLTDKDGYIWVGYRNRLCLFDGPLWECNEYESVRGNFFSGVQGRDGEIWLGSSSAEIMVNSGGELTVYDLYEGDLPVIMTRIEKMVYDEGTETLWIIDSLPPRCDSNSVDDFSDGVAQRNEEGEWRTYKKQLFARAPGEECSYYQNSIAITPDGFVWLGMFLRHSVAYYDGDEWKTMSGRVLPYRTEEYFPPSYDEGKCVAPGRYLVDLAVTREGDLLALTYEGVFRFTGFNYEVESGSQ